MKKFLIIYTPYGKSYIVNEKKEITHYDANTPAADHVFSGQWIFRGIVSALYGNNTIGTERLFHQTVLDDINFLFKNGNPRFTGMDIDHGSPRVWGNTQHHGIKSISIVTSK